MNYWAWIYGRVSRQLWWKAILYGCLGLFAAVSAMGAERYIPWVLPFAITQDAVDSLLNIIASSMLAVTTFSLGAMTSAFGAATSNVTPRATKLLMEDRVTQNVLSTFIGAFVFSIVGIVVLKTGSYGERGRAVLFVITIVVIVFIVMQLLRWINHLISLGRVGATIERVERVASLAITERLFVPYLGANRWHEEVEIPEGAVPIVAGNIGYVQFVDMHALAKLCDSAEVDAWIPVNAGAFVYEDSVLAWIVGDMPEDFAEKFAKHFIVETSRSFEQDPRFGLVVMAEIASRALSPATNDPGTALDVIGRQTRLLAQWAQGREEVDVQYTRLYLSALKDDDLFEDAFFLIARDGAHLIEVQLRLQKSLSALQRIGSPLFRHAAKKQAQLAFERAKSGLVAQCDVERLREEFAR